METDIRREYERFVDNYDFNRDLSLTTEKPHLARWACGACEEWIKDFQGSVLKTETMDVYDYIIEDQKLDLSNLKLRLRKKFKANKILMNMLK